MQRKRFSRWAVAAAVCSWPLLWAAPASANVTGPCDGSATIKGVTYTPNNDTPGNPVVIPNEKGVIVDWQGNTGGVVIKNHTGQIAVDVGPFGVVVADWSGENANKETEKHGKYNLDDAYDKLPVDLVGIYRVSGFHHGEGGACDGFVYVKIEGNPLSTVPGAGAAVLTLGMGALVLTAGKAKRVKR